MNDEEQFLMEWATKNHGRFEPEGECGFGRECVGILASNEHYPAWRGYEPPEYEPSAWNTPDAAPPDGVTDAYHKADCLAVLGRGDGPIHQLYLWVKNMEDHGIGIRMLPRKMQGNVLDALIHGSEEAVLTGIDAQ